MHWKIQARGKAKLYLRVLSGHPASQPTRVVVATALSDWSIDWDEKYAPAEGIVHLFPR